MAFTVSSIKNTVFGDMRVVFLNVTTDAAEGTVQVPGIASVISHNNHRVSGTQSFSTCTIVENRGSTSTVAAGMIAYSGAVNGAVYRLTVYGTS